MASALLVFEVLLWTILASVATEAVVESKEEADDKECEMADEEGYDQEIGEEEMSPEQIKIAELEAKLAEYEEMD